MNLLSRSAACLLTLAVSAPAAVAQSIRPGLWEIQRSTTSTSGEAEKRMSAAQERMANLPPEKRKLMEERMARSGVQMGSASAGSMSARVCVTPEMARHDETAEELLPGCQTTSQSRSASGVKLAFTCTNPRQSGETEISYQGPKAYSMRTTIHKDVNGKPDTVTKTGSGKWISDDCGSVTRMPGQR
ncbi:DUF3617 domain-containing protein [Ramlibacter sp. MMS24-I3-19]|uniref:DUF3617 domain-containing protein n=1 Tax=Ramlibacter sp. MMS24-I3-19 TaxID=3416606 RepID=UPI003D078083